MELKTEVPHDDREQLYEPVRHIESAYQLLKALNDKVGHLKRYPELKEAITKLELALNTLTLKTGGLL